MYKTVILAKARTSGRTKLNADIAFQTKHPRRRAATGDALFLSKVLSQLMASVAAFWMANPASYCFSQAP